MKCVALLLALCLFTFWAYGGVSYARIGDTEIYYFLGWATAALYLPLYLYRTRVEDKKYAEPRPSRSRLRWRRSGGVLRAEADRAGGGDRPRGSPRRSAPVYVFAIARVHGTSLGFPHPGLLPTEAGVGEQRAA